MNNKKIMYDSDGQWTVNSFISIENPVIVNNSEKDSLLLTGVVYENKNQSVYAIGKSISDRKPFRYEIEDFFVENCSYLSYDDVKEITKCVAELQGFIAANKDIRDKTDDVDYCCQVVECAYYHALSSWNDKNSNDFWSMINFYLDTCIKTREMLAKENNQNSELTIDEEDFEK